MGCRHVLGAGRVQTGSTTEKGVQGRGGSQGRSEVSAWDGVGPGRRLRSRVAALPGCAGGGVETGQPWAAGALPKGRGP